MIAASHIYRELPSDWVVVLTDVRNSTEAIGAGRYKDVNMVGVACIVAVQNALAGLSFPFVFGGDGATLALPADAIEHAKAALAHTRAVARRELGLELRVAVISAADIVKAGARLAVAKLQNTDYLKFDGALRMVVDVSQPQKDRLLAMLETLYREGRIFYGHHADPCALLTCYIQGPHKHIHFVDTGGGGYAMAAKELKMQKRASQ